MATGYRNIGGDANDGSYRYKMPKMLTKVEGKGNGIKTRIVNMNDIAKALHRKPEYVTKFFGCELGAQSKCIEKTGLSVVNGCHDLEAMNTLLDQYIQKWVLCPNCRLPETDLSVNGKNLIFVDCNACGHHAQCDMSSRLAVYIVKDPPKQVGRKKMDKKKAKEDADDQLFNETKAIKASSSSESWAVSTDEEAIEARRKQTLGNKSIDEIDLDNEPEWIVDFRKVLESEKSAADKKKALSRIQRRENVGNLKRAAAIFELTFDKDILKKLAKNLDLFALVFSHPRCQVVFLNCFAQFLDEEPTLQARACDVLNLMHDKDILKEEEILDWWTKTELTFVTPANRPKVREAIQPFIDWLEDDGEDDDEEDDDE
eukprot:TRINITY_DN800_c0_g1_i1.p1 TRINITY_DN800_c0_g1~~TRINITY_DN800_c0_g1_i1.p1  ORF type:complete len:410 (-),score=228.03 TRINITY_DN800_c0_g1_i1:33-1148(-)